MRKKLTETDKKFMRMAIAKAGQGIRKGQTPFGACIVRNGKMVVCVHNIVWATTDITAHAEINAIRSACQKLKTIDLSDCVLYSTCEPCPMCFAAIHWARIEKVIYGARISDAKKTGFNELTVSNRQMKSIGGSPVSIVSNFLREECVPLFEEWAARPENKVY
jgi:tRNA(Arg) A34 adenosine deaminase TadA